MTTPPTDPDKLKAAVKQLRAEREQLIEASIESGTVVRVAVFTTRGGNIEEAKQQKLAELKAAGEKRQVIFDEVTIFSGVPRDPGFFKRAQIVKADDAPKERARVEGEALRASDDFRAQYQR